MQLNSFSRALNKAGFVGDSPVLGRQAHLSDDDSVAKMGHTALSLRLKGFTLDG